MTAAKKPISVQTAQDIFLSSVWMSLTLTRKINRVSLRTTSAHRCQNQVSGCKSYRTVLMSITCIFSFWEKYIKFLIHTGGNFWDNEEALHEPDKSQLAQSAVLSKENDGIEEYDCNFNEDDIIVDWVPRWLTFVEVLSGHPTWAHLSHILYTFPIIR